MRREKGARYLAPQERKGLTSHRRKKSKVDGFFTGRGSAMRRWGQLPDRTNGGGEERGHLAGAGKAGVFVSDTGGRGIKEQK